MMTVRSISVLAATRSGLTAVVLATGMLMAACGGADDKTPASSEGAVSSTPAAPPGAASGAFCDAVKAQFAQLSAVGDASSVDAAVRQRYFVKQKELNATVRETAPSALRKDLETQTGAGDALADARLRGDAAAAAAAITLVTAPETQAAGARITAYVTEHCGAAASRGG